VLLDVQQIIPLPEAEDYQVRLRRKQVATERSGIPDGRDFTRYHITVAGRELPAENKRNAVRVMITELARAGAAMGEIRAQLRERAIRPLPGKLGAGEETEHAFAESYPGFGPRRFFTQHPIYEASTDVKFRTFLARVMV